MDNNYKLGFSMLALLLAACGGGGESATATADKAPAGAELTARALATAAETSPEMALTPIAATASSQERGDLSADKAIDRDDGSRWGSGFSDDQFLQLDYGKSVAISRVRIQWENAHAKDYRLEVSADGINWSLLKAVTNSGGGTEDFGELSGQGRYLRVKGLTRSTGYGYSIFEILAFSGAAAAPAPTPVPTPTPSDPGQPGVIVKPVAVSSSAVENAGMSAAMAVDGKANTRWASAKEDGAWLQFDFGAPVDLGYLQLVWENAYGKEYAIQVSDDGAKWTQLRYVRDGKGGTEEFFNLGVRTRYVRLQGVARATAYGYSLYEVAFKSPGSDNSLPLLATSAVPFPANGSGMTPLPGSVEPLETLQFTLPDGTLVTRFGVLSRARHARERGEDWNEIGLGPNDTVDPVTGLAMDKGPGNYLTFVANYFKNRTWGFEIIDNSRVAGVTQPTLKVNQYFPQAQLPGGVAWFRAFDRPGVTGYGWMNPGELVDRNLSLCPSVPYPPNGRLANANFYNNGCSLTVKDYPRHAELGADGLPNGKDLSARALVVGDVIEVSPSFFSTNAAMAAIGDNGGIRYYANEWTYVVGTGLRPWYGVQPRLMNAPLPAETLQGGIGSVSYDYADNGSLMFQQPPNNVGMKNMQRFVEGRRLIHTNFTTGEHNEPGNDRYQAAVGLQGARFNQSTCFACHTNNGRSPAPNAINQRLDAMSIHAATVDAQGRQVPHPRYGSSIQMNARSSSGALQDWGTGVRVAGFESRTVKLADGTAVELRKPKLGFDGPVPGAFSLRSAQPMIGVGLLEAVAEADILARVRSTPDEDGVKGQANFVFDPESGAVRLGRFGWKASKATLRHQASVALLQDMSVTSPVYPSRECLAGPAKCRTSAPQPGVSEAELQSITHYLALVAVPAQRSLPSGFPKGVAPLEEHIVNPQQVAQGLKLFQSARCSVCHTVEMKTGNGHLMAELRNQTIKPYTDLLLHDMGAGLADTLSEGSAGGAMWRTAPLWGVGYAAKVQGGSAKVGYLHDGRARSLTEAVMWHGGEADRSRQRFEALATAEREALLAFLKSL